MFKRKGRTNNIEAMAKKNKLVIELTEADEENIDIILSEIGRRIEEGFTSGIQFPVDWYLKKD